MHKLQSFSRKKRLMKNLMSEHFQNEKSLVTFPSKFFQMGLRVGFKI